MQQQSPGANYKQRARSSEVWSDLQTHARLPISPLRPGSRLGIPPLHLPLQPLRLQPGLHGDAEQVVGDPVAETCLLHFVDLDMAVVPRLDVH